MLKTVTMIVALLSATSALAADMRRMPEDARFCPTWAEAHERTLASLNNGRAPYKGHWKGCILIKKGEEVDLVDADDSSNEIIYQRRHWFSDGGPF
jgi:hypothetical protein